VQDSKSCDYFSLQDDISLSVMEDVHEFTVGFELFVSTISFISDYLSW
jgi:hypothetical protein